MRGKAKKGREKKPKDSKVIVQSAEPKGLESCRLQVVVFLTLIGMTGDPSHAAPLPSETLPAIRVFGDKAGVRCRGYVRSLEAEYGLLEEC